MTVTTNGFESGGATVWMLDTQGQPMLSLVPEEARARAEAFVNGCLSAGTAHAELPFRKTDGSPGWALVSGEVSPGASAIACIVIDITERKRLEDALRRSEANYRVLAETAQDHIFVITRGGYVEYVNRAAALQLRTTPDKVIGRLRTEIFPPEVAERQGRSLQRVMNTREPFYVEGRTMYLDREVWLGTWLTPIPGDDGDVRAVLGVSRDITEQRRLQKELSNAQKLEAIGRLAGGIAHDFNNNLTAILGYIEMVLARGDISNETARELREVQHAGQRAAGVVRRILAFGRRQVLQPTNLKLNAIVEDLRPMLERLIGESIQFDVQLAADPWSVSGDPTEFEQILMNLALNARDAMPGGGTLTIETANVVLSDTDVRPAMKPGPHVRLTVRDTGMGMDAKTKELVFEPFFTTKPVGEGTGLGLSTVYGIVKQLTGSIWVESEVGRGSAFNVFLPATLQGEVSLPETGAEPAIVAQVRSTTVLLVEDEETVRRYAKAALELHGFRVIGAATPEEAIAAAASEVPIELMLSDVVMPRMSGPDLAAHLRTTRPEMKVLYMSGYPATLVHGGLLDPSMRLISKPFRTADLLVAIKEMLGGP